MELALQASLFDAGATPAVRPLSDATRTLLGRGAWIDVLPGWLSGADAVFTELATQVPWRTERRYMYDRTVDVPRLLCFYEDADVLPHHVLDEARTALSEYYGGELGESFRTAGLCYYRDGRDSVAWHGDTIGRGSTEDTIVAIVSVGAPRSLYLRPRVESSEGSGASGEYEESGGSGERGTVRHHLGHGDLLVMGGSCQRTWEHAVPKTAKPVGPRISIQFRPHGVR